MSVMPVVEQSVTIALPPSEVWDFLVDAQNWATWESSVLECEQTSEGPPGVGARWRGVNRVLGKRIQWESEFVEFEPGKGSTSKSVEGGDLTFTATTRLEDVDGGGSTLLTYRLDIDSGIGGIFGKLSDPIVAKAHSRTVRASLDNLADLMTTDN
ncbi:SRPBCC family protein [Rhodococcus sp. NPDC058521]|uniref:SRPBCC family protein n=1 Tax=Rhodococcus sp. NPDC058521 TaxID=3346536 RepID=UPI00364E74BE